MNKKEKKINHCWLYTFTDVLNCPLAFESMNDRISLLSSLDPSYLVGDNNRKMYSSGMNIFSKRIVSNSADFSSLDSHSHSHWETN